MPRLLQLAGLFAALTSPVVSAAVQVVDRIVAHVEDDVLFQSELRELGQFQQLAGGQSETDAQLLDRLVDQWIVKTEADTARFPPPSDADVDRQVEHLRQQLASSGALESRLQRSEEHTSELQSRLHLVCRLLLEKKKTQALPD